MAYTGTDEDGGIGYVTATDPDVGEYLRHKVAAFGRRLRDRLAGIFGS